MCPTQRCWLQPVCFGKAQRVSPRTTVYRLPIQFALVISKFPSWPQYMSIITVMFKSPVTMAPFHSGYKLGMEWPKAGMGWWIISFSPRWSVNRSTWYDQCCSHLSPVRVPAVVHGHFSQLITQKPRLKENSWDRMVAPRREKGNAPPHL